MTVVVDVGCAAYAGDESIPYLVEEYEPGLLLGFDPNTEAREYRIGETVVIEKQAAAWIADEPLRFVRAGLGGRVDPNGPEQVEGFDLARLVRELRDRYPDDDLVVKLDCEGAEYELVPHLWKTDTDLLLAEILVEWHCEACRHGIISRDDQHPPDCPMTRRQWSEWVARRDKLERLVRCDVSRWGR